MRCGVNFDTALSAVRDVDVMATRCRVLSTRPDGVYEDRHPRPRPYTAVQKSSTKGPPRTEPRTPNPEPRTPNLCPTFLLGTGLRARPHRKHAQDARRVVVICRRGASFGKVGLIARITRWRARAWEDFQPFKLAMRRGEQRVRGPEKHEQQTQENTRPHVRFRL